MTICRFDSRFDSDGNFRFAGLYYNVTRSAIGNECSCRKLELMWSFTSSTTRAATCRTRCNGANVDAGRPASNTSPSSLRPQGGRVHYTCYCGSIKWPRAVLLCSCNKLYAVFSACIEPFRDQYFTLQCNFTTQCGN